MSDRSLKSMVMACAVVSAACSLFYWATAHTSEDNIKSVSCGFTALVSCMGALLLPEEDNHLLGQVHEEHDN